jgi:hypothetical protein
MAPPREAPVGFVVSATPLHQVAAWVAAIKGMDFSLLNPKSLKKPTPRLLFLAPVGPFVFWGIWENRRVEIEQRAGEVGFWDLGGLKSSVVEELEGAVVD